jgi:hypothetical protein
MAIHVCPRARVPLIRNFTHFHIFKNFNLLNSLAGIETRYGLDD